jgi:hypothetical protein
MYGSFHIKYPLFLSETKLVDAYVILRKRLNSPGLSTSLLPTALIRRNSSSLIIKIFSFQYKPLCNSDMT